MFPIGHDQEAADMGRILVAELAPEELSFYDELTVDNFRQKHQDHVMGFGLPDQAVLILSAFLLEAGKEIVAFLWANGKDSAGNFVKDCAEAYQLKLAKDFKAWLKGPNKGDSPIRVPKKNLAKLSKTIEDRAKQAGFSTDQQILLSKSIAEKFSDRND